MLSGGENPGSQIESVHVSKNQFSVCSGAGLSRALSLGFDSVGPLTQPTTQRELMYYYKRNIGDYHKKAGRLSMLEHGAYTLLIDSCYDREKFPTRDEAIGWCWARTDAEIAAVDFVLSKFFELIDGRYVQNRIQEEISEYNDKALKNKEIAIARENARKERLSRTVHDSSHSVDDTPPNHKPLTINQEPITNLVITQDKPAKKPDLDYSQWPSMPSDQTMQDWLAMRKRLKATVSQTVINRFAIELKKAKAYGYTVDQCLSECVTRGWRGFEVQWLLNSAQTGQYKTAAEKAAIRNESTFDYEKARDF